MAKRRDDRGSFREKSGSLYWRGWLPEKTEVGEIVWRSCERSARTLDVQKAWAVVEAWRQEAFTALSKPVEKRPGSGIVFAEAVKRYAKQHGGNSEYLIKLIDEIGMTPVEDIDQELIDGLAEKMYPGRAAATLNRHVYTPICAVLNAVASKKYKPPRIKRPKGHLAPSNYQRPPKDWFQRVLPECEPNLAAFLLFCRLHGRRTSEACRLKPADIDADTWRVTIHDTKVGQDIVLPLAGPVIDALAAYPWRLNQFVFGFSSKSRVYKPLKDACARASIPYHVPKDTGRHAFATALLDEGRSLMEVKEAGRWKTIKMPAQHYGHLEHRRVDDDARELGEKWAEKTLRKAEVIAPRKWAKCGQREGGSGK
jgi:integrase